MEKDHYVIGVDLGGTNMRAGLVKNSVILNKSANRVPVTENAYEVIQVLINTIRDVLTPEVEGIGVGVPSLVKADEGVVYDVQNIPSWKRIHLKDILEQEFHMPVYINNDANCYAAGERFFGEGQKYTDFVGLITGTGVGAGIIKKGHLLSDQHCGAGEFGMIPYLDNDYEYYCSGQFFMNKYNSDGGEMAAKALGGDDKALAAFQEYGTHLAKVIKVILLTLDPEAVIIGGSVSKSFNLYKEAMWKEIETYPYSFALENLKIIPSNIEEIAILGAAALYIDAQSN